MAPRSGRRQRVTKAFARLYDAVGRALGAAEGLRSTAVRAHAEAIAEMWLREAGLDAARADPGLRPILDNPRLAETVGRIEADRQAAFTPWLEDGPQRLDALLDRAAPGVARLPLDEAIGTFGTVTSAGPVPSLWLVGKGWIGDRPAGGFPVAVPLLDESHLQIGSTPDGRETAEALVQNLLLRVVSYFRPGLVQLHVWDVGSFTGTLPGLYPLTSAGLLTVHDPTRLPQLLEELSNRIRRVHTRVLVDGQPSLRALAGAGERSEPWVIAVLIGNRSALREEDHRQLQRVARGGLACGVQLVLLDVPVTVNAAVETVQVGDDGYARTSMTGAYVRVLPEPQLEPKRVTAACHKIAMEYDEWRSRIATFDDLLPAGEWGQESSLAGLEAPVAFAEGKKVWIRLGDTSPHALIGGPSGSGKTNLLLTMISSLATRYSPDEVAFYLLDFKEGVSFAQFATGPGRETWLPHARLIGVNINTDREFGLALLQFLSDEMRHRAAAAKAVGASKLEELREHEQGNRTEVAGSWPRIVAVIDEFQYLFGENDAVTKAAAILLEDVARRGRSQGIHLVLASQDTSSIQVFWGRPAVFEQFVLRIALPRARRVLVDGNDAAVGLPHWHAVINHESGTKHGNDIVRLPNASTKGVVEGVQRTLHEQYLKQHREQHPGQQHPEQPELFDGSRSPRISDLVKKVRAVPSDDELPRAVLGQCIDVTGRAAVVRLSATPGRNIGVLASIGKDAVHVLAAAAGSLAREFPADQKVRIVIAPLVADAGGPAAWVQKEFRDDRYSVETVDLKGLQKLLVTLAGDIDNRLDGDESGESGQSGERVLLVLFAADAVLERAGMEALRKVLHSGPETGVHVIGWWRSIQRLRALLTMGASVDDLGAWVALDVHGAELGPLVPGMVVSWAPRAGRGLFFDRAQHSQPQVIIVPTLDDL